MVLACVGLVTTIFWFSHHYYKLGLILASTWHCSEVVFSKLVNKKPSHSENLKCLENTKIPTSLSWLDACRSTGWHWLCLVKLGNIFTVKVRLIMAPRLARMSTGSSCIAFWLSWPDSGCQKPFASILIQSFFTLDIFLAEHLVSLKLENHLWMYISAHIYWQLSRTDNWQIKK